MTVGLESCEAAESGVGAGRAVLRLYVDEKQILASVVDGDVLMRLEEAKLADALCADAAGGEVGDAAGGELDAHVGDVDFSREDGKTDGLQGMHGRLNEAENDVEVMHHEIEDDVDVERARGEDAEPVGLKEHGHVDIGMDGEDGGVEPLEMTDLKDALVE